MKTPVRKPKKAPSARSAAKTQGLLVLGMHRSGTSAITRVLNLLGCALPNNLIGPSDSNETGHWESVDALQLNDAILDSAGSDWADWGAINDDWHRSGLKAEMLGRIEQVIEHHAALGPLFALKDPRTCRVADLWLTAMYNVNVEPCVLLMLRNPAEVCASLEERDLMATGYGQLLWLRHVLDAEYFSRGVRRVVCRYDQLMRSWPVVVDRIRTGLDIALPRNTPAVHAAIEQYLKNEYRHHERSADAVLGDLGQSAWLRRTFAIMMAWSEQGENEADHAELDQIRHELGQAHATFARLLLRTDAAGAFDTGSQLKRELREQLDAARQAAQSAREAVQEAEARQTAAAGREAQLQANLEASHAATENLQTEIAALRSEAEYSGQLAAEANALRVRGDQLEQEVSRLEAALQAATTTIEQERQQRLAADRTLATQLGKLHDQQVRNAELAGRAATAESALVQRQEELSQLWSQLLAAEKAAAVAEAKAAQGATAAQDAVERALARQAQEHEQLQARLQKQEAAARAAESSRAQAEQKLAVRFDEIARLTSFLAEEGARSTAAAANTEWLRSMMNMAASFPRWWAIMPDAWRRKREHARYRRSGLFDAERYLDTYPDVAAHGMDPVRHYILHGISEGRSRPA